MDTLTNEFVAESREGLDRMERCLTELEEQPHNRALIDEIFRAVHTIKGSTGFLGFTRLEILAHAGETLLSSMRAERIATTTDVISGLLELLDSLRVILRLIELTGGEGQRRTDDDFVTIARLMELNEAGMVAAALARIATESDFDRESIPEPPQPDTPGPVPDPDVPDEIEARSSVQPIDRTLRVDVEVLNRLMNQVGELVLTRNQLLRSEPVPSRFDEIARKLDSVTSDLRETVMRLRMQPAGHLFGKFPRLVRDLAHACGKQVRLEVEGHDTGLDKSLIEAIRDPLTHALRNAIDHGIETPPQRLLAGKPPQGVIRLRALHQNGSVVVEVQDDGAGIRAGKVAAKAIESGLIAQECVARLSEQERMQLVFLPGVTTAEDVTNVSGRGVGMDVVRADVEKAGGSVQLESLPGEGTTLRLILPLTLAIIPALMIRSAGHIFAVPQDALVELMYRPSRAHSLSPEPAGDLEVCRTRDGVVPLIRLAPLLGFMSPTALEQDHHILLLDHQGCRFGLLVDNVVAPEEIVVKPLSALLRRSGLFSGAALLGGGELAFILNLDGIRNAAGIQKECSSALGLHRPERLVTLPSREPVIAYELEPASLEGAPPERRFVPLSAVDRVERLQLSHAHTISGRTFVDFGTDLLELNDPAGILDHSRATEAVALISHRGAQKQALLVNRVIEICDKPIPSGAGEEPLFTIPDGFAVPSQVGPRPRALLELA